jgi:hypothetical protein
VWARVFTDELLRQKRAGASFDRAWERALYAFPAGRRELGLRGWREGTLRTELEVQRTLEWFRAACEDAWEGRAPRLRLLPQLVGHLGVQDRSGSARRLGRGGYAEAA